MKKMTSNFKAIQFSRNFLWWHMWNIFFLASRHMQDHCPMKSTSIPLGSKSWRHFLMNKLIIPCTHFLLRPFFLAPPSPALSLEQCTWQTVRGFSITLLCPSFLMTLTDDDDDDVDSWVWQTATNEWTTKNWGINNNTTIHPSHRQFWVAKGASYNTISGSCAIWLHDKNNDPCLGFYLNHCSNFRRKLVTTGNTD